MPHGSPANGGEPALTQDAPRSPLTYTVFCTDPIAALPAQSRASEPGPVTATADPAEPDSSGHGVPRAAEVSPPSPVTTTLLPSSTAATRAWVAITRALVTRVTTDHGPPDSARRSSVSAAAHPDCAVQLSMSASSWPSMTSRSTIEPAGPAAAVQCSPPSVVTHSPLPNTKP